MKNLSMTNEQVESLAFDALNVACLEIQEKLNVESGDLAGMYFSGKAQDLIIEILSGYISAEIQEGQRG